MTNDAVPRRRFPCARCPWKRETPPGEFSAERYEALKCTSEQPDGIEPGLSAPMFACHKTDEGAEEACAGWLAAVGHRHIGVRLAVAHGRLDAAALRPGEGWPELFDAYEEMAAHQGRPREGKEPHP